MAKGSGAEAPTEHILGPYMPMGIDEFGAVDPDIADHGTWKDYLRMKIRMVRDARETPEAKTYFDGIQAAFEQSFDTITPEVLADPDQLNLVRCVDKYSDTQLDDLNFPADQQQSLPAGLGWFDLTGTTDDWVVARIFKPRLAAGLHRNCGGFAITGALTGERQAAARDRSLTNTLRIAAEIAATVRQEYFRRMGTRLDPEARRALAAFGGPQLILPVGAVGTAEPFVTPKTAHIRTIDQQYNSRELKRHVETWVDNRLATQQEH